MAFDYKDDGSVKPTRDECLQMCRNARVFVDESQLRGLTIADDPFGPKAGTTTMPITTTGAYAGAGAGANASFAALTERQTALLLQKLEQDAYERAREKDARNPPTLYEQCDLVIETPRSCSSYFYYVKHFSSEISADVDPYFSVTAKVPWSMLVLLHMLFLVLSTRMMYKYVLHEYCACV